MSDYSDIPKPMRDKIRAILRSTETAEDEARAARAKEALDKARVIANEKAEDEWKRMMLNGEPDYADLGTVINISQEKDCMIITRKHKDGRIVHTVEDSFGNRKVRNKTKVPVPETPKPDGWGEFS